MLWGAILGAKVAPKWLQNSIKKISDFWIALGRAQGRQSGFQYSKIRPARIHGETHPYRRGEILPPLAPGGGETARAPPEPSNSPAMPIKARKIELRIWSLFGKVPLGGLLG